MTGHHPSFSHAVVWGAKGQGDLQGSQEDHSDHSIRFHPGLEARAETKTEECRVKDKNELGREGRSYITRAKEDSHSGLVHGAVEWLSRDP